MTAALLAFLAALLAGTGARDQVLLAGLAARRFLPPALLVLAAITSATAGIVLALAAQAVSPSMTGEARVFFAGLASAFSGLECLFIVPGKTPQEPTRSYFAHAFVLLVHQLTDGARFLIFAIAVATAVPQAAALGGAAGGIATVLIGAMAGEALLGRRTVLVRRMIGVVLTAVGAWLVMQALA